MPADKGGSPGNAAYRQVVLPTTLRHDLLNSINAVIGYATLLQEDLPEGQERQWVDRLIIAAREAQSLSESIPPARPPTKGRVLLLAAGPTGDAMELELDRLDFSIVRVLDAAELRDLMAAGFRDADLLLAEVGTITQAEVGAFLPLIGYQPGEGPEAVAARLGAALAGLPRGGAKG